jgi:hypothetical protein
MADQLSFVSLDFAAKKKRTKRDVFLGEMLAVVPSAMLEALIEPHYPKLGPQGVRRPFPLLTMLRIYCEVVVLWTVKEKARPGRELTKRQRARNRRFGRERAKVEYVFRVLNCQFNYRRARYRGIAKIGAQVFALLALANLFLARCRLASA